MKRNTKYVSGGCWSQMPGNKESERQTELAAKKEKTAVQGLIWIVLYNMYKGSNKSNGSSSAPAKKKQLEIQVYMICITGLFFLWLHSCTAGRANNISTDFLKFSYVSVFVFVESVSESGREVEVRAHWTARSLFLFTPWEVCNDYAKVSSTLSLLVFLSLFSFSF